MKILLLFVLSLSLSGCILPGDVSSSNEEDQNHPLDQSETSENLDLSPQDLGDGKEDLLENDLKEVDQGETDTQEETSDTPDLNLEKDIGASCVLDQECLDSRCMEGICDLPLEVETGTHHSCFLSKAGRVACWGSNTHGQLGTGDQITRAFAQFVPDIEGATQLALGALHTCAVVPSETGEVVKCWGDNAKNQIQEGFDELELLPRAVPVSGEEIHQLVAGDEHSCAFLNFNGNDLVRCWGSSEDNRLGEHQNIGSESNHVLSFLEDGTPAAIGAGRNHTCAFVKGETENWLECWGSNKERQLGNNVTFGNNRGKLDLKGASLDQIALAIGGTTTCYVFQEEIECTGTEIGAPDGHETLVAQLQTLALGEGYACLTTASNTHCWGDNRHGQLGIAPTLSSSAPSSLNHATSLSLSLSHTCMITDDNEVECLGARSHGKLGDGLQPYTHQPLELALRPSTGGTWTKLEAGLEHICAFSDAGEVYCWGENGEGQISEDRINVGAPVPFTPRESGKITGLGLSVRTTCVSLESPAKVICEGPNDERPETLDNYPLLEVGTDRACGVKPTGANPALTFWTINSPIGVNLASQTTDFDVGSRHICYLTTNGHVKCQGQNGSGQLGVPAGPGEQGPTTSNSEGHDRVFTNLNATCATNEDGLHCWGDNQVGQLYAEENETIISNLSPTLISERQFISVGIGSKHTCAATHQAIFCWGDNTLGQAGDDQSVFLYGLNEPSPFGLDNKSPVEVVSAKDFSCARFSDDTIACWGLMARLGQTSYPLHATNPVSLNWTE